MGRELLLSLGVHLGVWAEPQPNGCTKGRIQGEYQLSSLSVLTVFHLSASQD